MSGVCGRKVVTSLGAAALVLGLLSGGCSVIVDADIKPGGIGAVCSSTADCQGGTCSGGICVSKCSVSADCPAGAQCFDGLCQVPLKVAGLWVGVVSGGEGWTLTHQEGMDAARSKLSYVEFTYKEALLGDAFADAIDEAASKGYDVIVGNSFSHQPQMQAKAVEYPELTFLIASGYPNSTNMGAYWGHLEQAWYVAGKVAAQQSKTGRIGYIVPYVSGELTRHGNAFLRGAQAVKADIKMEVRYLGFWYDYNEAPTYKYKPRFLSPGAPESAPELTLFAEEYLAAKMIDSGVDVIAHGADNQRVVRFVEKYFNEGYLREPGGAPTVHTLGNDNQFACRDANQSFYRTCVGSPYWNWTPLYVRLLDQIHRHTWTPGFVNEPMAEAPEERVVSFEPNLSAGVDGDTVRKQLSEAATAGWEKIFEGPWETTGQRAPMPAGQSFDEAEWRAPCFWIKGAVERSNPQDPTSPDIPARVPSDDYQVSDPNDPAPVTAPEIVLPIPGLERGIGWNCRSNS